MGSWWTPLAVAAVATLALACSDTPASDDAQAAEAPLTSVSEATRLLYVDAPPPAACASGGADERVTCLITSRYAPDPASRDIALGLFRTTGGVAGVLPAEDYDGGYRGTIRLVPELPVGGYRQHLVWATQSLEDIDVFFRAVARRASAPIHYRWREVHLAFFRSVGRTTPSAFTTDRSWAFSYNVAGSLNTSRKGVEDTVFHELFHMNDWARDDWSSRLLAPIVAPLIARCGTNKTCLAPYTPTDVTVGGGMYYAFQPGAPTALEYAAELAVRYHEEQQAMVDGRALAKPAFKCGAPENAQAWQLIVDEFFGGADLVPSCAR
jgi:hypothetical protein